jgi:phosphoenolpyruvate-protein phosphotransferase
MLEGVPASPGVAIGPVEVLQADIPELEPREIEDVDIETARLETAIAAVLERLGSLAETAGEEAAEIFEAHTMFLDDPSFAGEAVSRVRSEAEAAEIAVNTVAEGLATEFEAIGDEYFSARAIDVRDIRDQLVRELLGLAPPGFAHLTEPVVIVAHDLTPSETVTVPTGMALAFVTAVGSATSHTAILARSLGIPAVVGIGGMDLPEGATIAVDGAEGHVWIDPDPETEAALRERMAADAAERAAAEATAGEPAITTDGHQIEVVANVGNPEDAARADEMGAEGVGLFRTEFLFIDRGTTPDEEQQYEAYRQVFEVFGDRPVVVRTLDIGGDKDVPGVDVGEELNPFLGKRGIRLTLDDEGLFVPQLRALLRAAAGANLKLMFPMVATLAEIEATRAVLDRVAGSLRDEGLEHADDFEVGIMIEVPSAAITADLLAPHVDFFSIGTNDLTQYVLAVDRTNPSVAGLADALHPAVLRMIGSVIEAAHAHGKWVGLCGELAGDPLAAPVLLGLGLDEWSMNPPSIPLVKEKVRGLSRADSVEVAARCLTATSADEVREILAGV